MPDGARCLTYHQWGDCLQTGITSDSCGQHLNVFIPTYKLAQRVPHARLWGYKNVYGVFNIMLCAGCKIM